MPHFQNVTTNSFAEDRKLTDDSYKKSLIRAALGVYAFQIIFVILGIITCIAMILYMPSVNGTKPLHPEAAETAIPSP